MIYRDVLGRPAALVTIRLKQENKSRQYRSELKEWREVVEPAYYYISTVSDYKHSDWDGNTPISSIVEEMESAGFSCEVRKDGYNRPAIFCTHAETQKLIDDAKAESERKFASSVKGFVRFGRCPKNGKSMNHRDNTPEAGVSCFEAEFAEDGSYRLMLTPVLEVSYLTVKDRQAYRLYGEVIGTGADGEPLLRVDRSEKI